MLGTSGDDDKVTSLDLLLLSSNDGLGYTRGEDEVLVNSVDLGSDET